MRITNLALIMAIVVTPLHARPFGVDAVGDAATESSLRAAAEVVAREIAIDFAGKGKLELGSQTLPEGSNRKMTIAGLATAGAGLFLLFTAIETKRTNRMRVSPVGTIQLIPTTTTSTSQFKLWGGLGLTGAGALLTYLGLKSMQDG